MIKDDIGAKIIQHRPNDKDNRKEIRKEYDLCAKQKDYGFLRETHPNGGINECIIFFQYADIIINNLGLQIIIDNIRIIIIPKNPFANCFFFFLSFILLNL